MQTYNWQFLISTGPGGVQPIQIPATSAYIAAEMAKSMYGERLISTVPARQNLVT